MWKPESKLDSYTVQSIWTSYNVGEKDQAGQGLKPAVRLVEEHFGHKWRTNHLVQILPSQLTVLKEKGTKSAQKKQWQRYREIPQWIERQSTSRNVSPRVIIGELEALPTAASLRH